MNFGRLVTCTAYSIIQPYGITVKPHTMLDFDFVTFDFAAACKPTTNLELVTFNDGRTLYV